MATTNRMFATPFYHGLIKQTIVGFGSLFSDIKIIRENRDGEVSEIVKVPIAYGPKEKILQRLDGDPTQDGHVYITLPRLSFEIEGYVFDPERKVNKNNKIQCLNENGLTMMYAPVPYNIDITLYLLTKGTEDSLAVIEQILPLFNPEYTLRVNSVPSMNIATEVPIILNNVSVQDDYEGDFATRRLVTHTFNFTAKMHLYGPVRDRSDNVILRTETAVPDLGEKHTSVGDPVTYDVILDEWTNI